MTRCALYARVSTDEQAERYGLAAQLHELRAGAAGRGYTVPNGAEFADDGYSGATLERPALTRLRDAVREGAVDVVLVHDPDRLSRRLAHQRSVADVASHEGVARIGLDVAEVREVAGVGQLVEVDDVVVGVRAQDVPHEVGTDEARAAGDEEAHGQPRSTSQTPAPAQSHGSRPSSHVAGSGEKCSSVK